MDEVFSELSPEPLGAASLAQCHRGVLRDGGKVVAVKIQHPDVHTNAYTDMDTIQVRMAVCVVRISDEYLSLSPRLLYLSVCLSLPPPPPHSLQHTVISSSSYLVCTGCFPTSDFNGWSTKSVTISRKSSTSGRKLQTRRDSLTSSFTWTT